MTLTDFWGATQRELPPLYFFLSSQSHGSLSKRTPEEINLVHHQQALGEGITLRSPPLAYVSKLSQIPEETAHLFALVHQRPRKSKAFYSSRAHQQIELRFMTLHEAFGRFSSFLVTGQHPWVNRPTRSQARNLSGIWKLAHQEGYYLAQILFDRYCSGKVSQEDLQRWFQLNWLKDDGLVAMRRLYSLTQKTSLSKNFC